MTIRFVLDESSWRFAWDRRQELADAIDSLSTRVETATDRAEGVARHADLYEADLGDGIQLYAALFDPDCPLQLDRDLAERLRLAMDRAHVFADEDLESYDVSIGGVVRFAPGVSWAHRRIRDRQAVAVLPLAIEDPLQGEVPVVVSGVERAVHFVVSESCHRGFFRSAIVVEDVDPEAFSGIAQSAFPDLRWANGVWGGLRRHRRHFFGEHRATLVRHLSVLDDDGASLFHANPGGQGIDQELGARGVDASPENGNARRHNPSIADRRRNYDGVEHVFWWHTKICWNLGRVHFVHIPPRPHRGDPPHGHIAVGIFTDHCVLP